VHLAVAKHAPHLAALAVEQATVREVAHEARVVDRADGADAHGARGKLPELRHEPGVRVAGQPLRTLGGARDLAAVVLQVALGQPSFQEGTRVYARGAVRLEEHEITP